MKDSGDIVLTKNQNGSTSKLVFYNISKLGFSWRGEQVINDGNTIVTWRKKCIKE